MTHGCYQDWLQLHHEAKTPAAEPARANAREARDALEAREPDEDTEGGAEEEEEDAARPILPRSLPTVNLLGWRRAKAPTATQRD